MTISYPRTMPSSPGIKSNRFGLDFNVDVYESPISRIKQTNHRPGDMWVGIIQLPVMLNATAKVWKAWFASLNGQVGTFYAYDPDGRDPEGIADTGSDTPIVNGASQTGKTIVTSGWRTTGSGLLLPGDYFSIGNELKMVTETVDSVAGAATISFEPAWHSSPANGASLVFNSPKGIFRLSENFTGWESDQFGRHVFSFPIEEVL